MEEEHDGEGLAWFGIVLKGFGVQCLRSAKISRGTLLVFTMVYYDGRFNACGAEHRVEGGLIVVDMLVEVSRWYI